MQLELRRQQNNLVILGGGVIAFSLWGLLKMLLILITANTQKNYILQDVGEGMAEKIAFYVLFFIFIFADLLFRIYIGRSAIAEGRGKRKGTLYLLFAILLFVFYMAGIGLNMFIKLAEYESLEDRIVQTVIEITSAVIYLELFISALRTRAIQRKMALAKEM
ncbi:MAG: hypothetical protein J5947_01790 [Clostridium sp.]|nr:hypothetical protein [Clostridium sp.]